MGVGLFCQPCYGLYLLRIQCSELVVRLVFLLSLWSLLFFDDLGSFRRWRRGRRVVRSSFSLMPRAGWFLRWKGEKAQKRSELGDATSVPPAASKRYVEAPCIHRWSPDFPRLSELLYGSLRTTRCMFPHESCSSNISVIHISPSPHITRFKSIAGLFTVAANLIKIHHLLHGLVTSSAHLVIVAQLQFVACH